MTNATVGTARSTELGPMARGILADTGREVDTARIHLGGLTGADLKLLISDLVGSAAPPELVQSVAAATDGNPFSSKK